MAVGTTPAAAPAAAGTPAAPAARTPHARTHGVLDLLAIIASALYAAATFVLCVWGASLLTPGSFNTVQDVWGIVTTVFTVTQVMSVALQADSYKHSVIGKLEMFSSLATISVVVVVGILFLVGGATAHHWAMMIWLNALVAGLIDLALLRHAYWLARLH